MKKMNKFIQQFQKELKSFIDGSGKLLEEVSGELKELFSRVDIPEQHLILLLKLEHLLGFTNSQARLFYGVFGVETVKNTIQHIENVMDQSHQTHFLNSYSELDEISADASEGDVAYILNEDGSSVELFFNKHRAWIPRNSN